jgi:alpha-L-fucosidase
MKLSQRRMNFVLSLSLLAFTATLAETPRPLKATELPARPDRSAAIESFRSHPFGLFIHFGIYSVYGGVYKGKPVKTTYLEQIMGRAHIPRDEFMATASKFDLSKFDADEICRLAKDAGMTQIVVTTKHHDGFCMFRTSLTPRNIVDLGPSRRDPIAELANACAKHNLALGFYYSIVDWSEGCGFDWNNDNPVTDELIAFECGQLKELLTQYGPVSQIWFDMGRPTPEQSRRLAETVWKLQPTCAVNGRVWNEQGDFITLGDNAVTDTVIREPWQTPASIEHATWGYCSWLEHPLDAKTKGLHIAHEFSRVLSHGGCYLINIGPQGTGAIDPYERETIEALGAWVRAHRAAITGTRAVDFFSQLPWGAATAKDNRLYLHIHDPSKISTNGLTLPGLRSKILKAQLLNGPALPVGEVNGVPSIAWKPDSAGDKQVTIIAVDLDAAPVVLPPLPEQLKPGVLALNRPYTRLNRNGSGYYHAETMRSVAYDFHLPAGGEQKLLLRLAKPAADSAFLRCRILSNDKVLQNQVIPVPAGVSYLDLGRTTLPANEALQINLESHADQPGSILPIVPRALYLVAPSVSAGPAAIWQ